jgi:hypothetical protein
MTLGRREGRGFTNYDTRDIKRKSLAQKPLPSPSQGRESHLALLLNAVSNTQGFKPIAME